MTILSDSFLGRALSEFLVERSGLDQENKEKLARSIKNLVQALYEGHTCLELNEEQLELLEKCRLVSENGELPLVLSGSKLYLARYFKYEQNLADKLKEQAEVLYQLNNIEQLLDLCFSPVGDKKDWQREAAKVALSRGLCIVSGGPGTGKTTTIVKIVGLLLSCYGPGLRVALAAPTGKAAMRMRESVVGQKARLPVTDEIKKAIPDEVKTLHRLLGPTRFSPKFRHNRKNPMAWDVVVVDEASMVDLAMMSKLSEAMKPGARLILIGDKDQLVSVESGAVLSDCIHVMKQNVVELKKTYRFDSSISELAGLVNRGESGKALEMLKSTLSPDVLIVTDSNCVDRAADNYCRFVEKALAADGVKALPELFRQLNKFRVLCAIRYGSRGVLGVNELIERHLAVKGFECAGEQWYTGRPVMINRNDYTLGLYNGDIGICLPDFDDGKKVVWFEQGDGTFRSFLPSRLVSCETVWAMTIHKSQGSEFDEVLVILPEDDNPVLCRELLYTAVTRARRKVEIFSDEEVAGITIKKRIERNSGLVERLEAGRNII